jgi:hypothetical protein
VALEIEQFEELKSSKSSKNKIKIIATVLVAHENT